MRPWIKAYTARVTEAEFLSLTDGAVALWYKCNLWVGLNETDGVIPAVEVERLKGTPSKVKRLLDAGFWEETETDNGKLAYMIVGWCDDQLTAKEVKELRERGADRTAKSRRVSDQNSRVSEPNSGVSENKPPKFRSQEGPDQRKREAVTPLEKRREEEIRPDETTAEPSGRGDDEQKTETRDGNTTTPSLSDSAPAPDNSASSSRNQEPVVDTSATKKEPSDHNPGSYEHLPHEERLEALLELVRQQRKAQSA